MNMQIFEMTIDGATIKWEEKSHAQIFRNFWKFFTEKDLQRTIETVELVGIRTSKFPYFTAKNGSKKKNIFIKDNYYIYGHLTPQLMQNTYTKFIAEWEEGTEAKKKTIPVPLNVWFNELSGNIHMNVGGTFTRINNDPTRTCGDPSLYELLEEHLRQAGKIE
ncbi:hypothetical protein KFD70_06790 [Bacillus pfraonensis]|uniref:hypothetical protein n=1 Tax=Bacillus TaxID=1386 RepID=UPI003012A341